MRLGRVSRPGKIQEDEWICYVSELNLHFYCRYYLDLNIYYDCDIYSFEIEVTCYMEEDEDDRGDDGDDDDSGGSGRHIVDCDANPVSCEGDDWLDPILPVDDEDEENSLSLTCSSSVTRGDNASCDATVYKDDIITDHSEMLFEWSSDVSASLSQTGINEWSGTAIENTTVTLEIKEHELAKTAFIAVMPRTDWAIPPAPIESTTYGDLGTAHGRYNSEITNPEFGAPLEGSGPWEGRYGTGTAPSFTGSIIISSNYSGGPLTYRDARKNTCRKVREQNIEYATYAKVNGDCGTTGDLGTFAGQVLDHEIGHNTSQNRCLGEAKALDAMSNLEAITGNSSTHGDDLNAAWGRFISTIWWPAMLYSPDPPGGVNFYFVRFKGAWNQEWRFGTPQTNSHSYVDCNL